MAGEFTASPPAWVRPYLRIPYSTLDCWRLCGHICKTAPPLLGLAPIEIPDFSEDLAHTAEETLWAIRLSDAVNQVVSREQKVWPRVDGLSRPFDIALYRVKERWHVATVAGGGWAVTTDLTRGSHPIRLCDDPWAPRLEGYYRHAALG